MARIAAISTALPSQYYTQEHLAGIWARWVKKHDVPIDAKEVESIFANSLIKGRYFAADPERFDDPPGFGTPIAEAIESATDLCEENVNNVLEQAGLRPRDISLLVSVTNLPAIPSLEARIMNRIGFPLHTKRMPIVGLGCMAGTAGLARVADYLAGHPKEAVVFMSAELCSGMWQGYFQRDTLELMKRRKADPSVDAIIMSNVVSGAIFSDGSGAALVVGAEHPLARKAGPRLMGSRSMIIPSTLHLMGLEFIDTGYRNILGAEVPERARYGLRQAVDGLFDEHGVRQEQIAKWIVHPGGPKVIQAAEKEFNLPEGTLNLSRETLGRIGNVSSATVLFMLEEVQKAPPPVDSPALLMAMGPGFSQEAVLLRW